MSEHVVTEKKSNIIAKSVGKEKKVVTDAHAFHLSIQAGADRLSDLGRIANAPKRPVTQKKSKAEEEEPVQAKPENNTGLPDTLKAGIEDLSGLSMDDVKVHFNSSKPASLNAHAYAQGTDIHVAAGQEKHLPHEAWHVVQQKQGRVKPTLQMKGKFNINDDAGLEKEADDMGGRAVQMKSLSFKKYSSSPIAENVIQRIMSVPDFQALTPASKRRSRHAVSAIDAALATYRGAKTMANINALIIAINTYRVGDHYQPRIAAANLLYTRAQDERSLLHRIGPVNAHIIDGLLDIVPPVDYGSLFMLAQIATPAGGAILPFLIQQVGLANIGNAHLLTCVQEAGVAHLGLLPPMIQTLGGGVAPLADLAALLSRPGKNASHIYDLTQLVAGNMVEFNRLATEVPVFQQTAAPLAVPPAVTAERNAYNNAKDNGYVAAILPHINTMHAAAILIRNAAHALGAPIVLYSNANQNLVTLINDQNTLVAGPPYNLQIGPMQNNINILRGRLNGLNGWANGQPASPNRLQILNQFAVFDPAKNAFDGVPPALSNQRDLDQIDYGHFLVRHTHHYFDFGDIKQLNTMWPRIWGAGVAAQLDICLVNSINHLHNAPDWFQGGNAKNNIPTGVGGTLAHMIAYNSANDTLRLGMFYPEPAGGPPIYQYSGDLMRAINKIL
jgi:hypothetical protein